MKKIWITLKSSCFADLIYGSGVYRELYSERPYIVRYAPTMTEFIRKWFIDQNENTEEHDVKGMVFGLIENGEGKSINTYTEYCETVSMLKTIGWFNLSNDDIVLEVKLKDGVKYPMLNYDRFHNAIKIVDHEGYVTCERDVDDIKTDMFLSCYEDSEATMSAIPEISVEDICGIHPPCGWTFRFDSGIADFGFVVDKSKMCEVERYREYIMEIRRSMLMKNNDNTNKNI